MHASTIHNESRCFKFSIIHLYFLFCIYFIQYHSHVLTWSQILFIITKHSLLCMFLYRISPFNHRTCYLWFVTLDTRRPGATHLFNTLDCIELPSTLCCAYFLIKFPHSIIEHPTYDLWLWIPEDLQPHTCLTHLTV